MSDPLKVLVACCNGSARIHKSVVFAAINMLREPLGHSVRFIMPTHSPYVQNLHKTMHDFLKAGEDFLLIMDDDNPPTRNPMELVALDKDIIGLPTPVWNNQVKGDRPYYANAMRAVYKREKRHTDPLDDVEGFRPLDSYPDFKPTGLQECDAVGTGCVLIKRRVLLELSRRARGNPKNTPFMRKWNDRGEVEMGNDFAFCTRAKAAGFKVFAHFDYMCQHFNNLEITEVQAAMMEMRLVNHG